MVVRSDHHMFETCKLFDLQEQQPDATTNQLLFFSLHWPEALPHASGLGVKFQMRFAGSFQHIPEATRLVHFYLNCNGALQHPEVFNLLLREDRTGIAPCYRTAGWTPERRMDPRAQDGPDRRIDYCFLAAVYKICRSISTPF